MKVSSDALTRKVTALGERPAVRFMTSEHIRAPSRLCSHAVSLTALLRKDVCEMGPVPNIPRRTDRVHFCDPGPSDLATPMAVQDVGTDGR